MMLMGRKPQAPGAVDANGWLLSYANMVTILLAMFISLSTLSKDQTGLSLYYGTDSYRDSAKRFGMPARPAGASRLTPGQGQRPLLHVGAERAPERAPGAGAPGDEQLHEFLTDVRKDFDVARLPREYGRIMVDFHAPLQKTGSRLSATQVAQVDKLIEMVRQRGYAMEVVAWVPTPHESALVRSTKLGRDLRAEMIAHANLGEETQGRVTSLAQTWPYKDLRRPVFSVIVARQAVVEAK